MWSGNDDPRVFSLVAPYLDIFALLAMRCVSKKIRNVFSRSKIREVLGITDGKQQHDPLVTYDSCFLVFLSLWDFYEEKKKCARHALEESSLRGGPGTRTLDKVHWRHASRRS